MQRVAQFQADKAMFYRSAAPTERPLPAEWIARARRRSRLHWRQAGAIAAVFLMVAIGPLAWLYYAPATSTDAEAALTRARAPHRGPPQLQPKDRPRRYRASPGRRLEMHIPDLSRMVTGCAGCTYDKAAETFTGDRRISCSPSISAGRRLRAL
jgi:hypothetical protein